MTILTPTFPSLTVTIFMLLELLSQILVDDFSSLDFFPTIGVEDKFIFDN